MEKLILDCVASYGLEVRKSVPALTFRNQDGYGSHLLIGDARGVKEWDLVFDFLTTDPSLTVTLDTGEVQTTFDYLRGFWDRHHYPEMKPFYITCPEDALDYSVEFAEHSRAFTNRGFRMWTGRVRLVQVRAENGAQLGESPVVAPNPQEI